MHLTTLALVALTLVPAAAACPLPDPEPLLAPAVSQHHDTCTMLVGPRPPCGDDAEVPQDQACPEDAALPPLGGGWVGDTRHNANGALQAACGLVPGPPASP
jgi:hypothetical protein